MLKTDFFIHCITDEAEGALAPSASFTILLCEHP